MKTDFTQWLSKALVVGVPERRAADTWSRIAENPTVVLFHSSLSGSGYVLDAQSVRIEPDSTVLDVGSSDEGSGYYRRVVIFGVRGHPTIPDTDIQRGYRFVYMGHEFYVCDVIYRRGEVQAYAEMVS